MSFHYDYSLCFRSRPEPINATCFVGCDEFCYDNNIEKCCFAMIISLFIVQDLNRLYLLYKSCYLLVLGFRSFHEEVLGSH